MFCLFFTYIGQDKSWLSSCHLKYGTIRKENIQKDPCNDSVNRLNKNNCDI